MGVKKEADMTDRPHESHSEDAVEAAGAPTDAVTDEVRDAAAEAETEAEAADSDSGSA
jgi:hypothetical protein